MCVCISRPDRLRDIADRFNLDQDAVLDNVLYARAYTSNSLLSLSLASTMEATFASLSSACAPCLIHTHTHPFNSPLSRTTWVSRYQKGKTNLYFTEARDSEWQWHQLGHMQVCTLLQTDSHASTPPLSFYRLDALPAAQPTASKHWKQLDHTLAR